MVTTFIAWLGVRNFFAGNDDAEDTSPQLRGTSEDDDIQVIDDSRPDILTFAGNDSVTIAAPGDFRIETGFGADTVDLGDGDSTVFAGNGDDSVTGGLDAHTVNLGEGNDAYAGANGAGTASGGVGDDTLFGGLDDDTLRGGQGADFITGGEGDDALFGGPSDDHIVGGEGDDNLVGGQGADLIFGAQGDDTLNGYAGNGTLNAGGTALGLGAQQVFGGVGEDSLIGNEGDTLTGGANADDFVVEVFNGRPSAATLITDFDPDLETLALRLDADDFVDATTPDLTVETLDATDGSGLEVVVNGAKVMVLTGITTEDEIEIDVQASAPFDTGIFAGAGNASGTTLTGTLQDDTLQASDAGSTLRGEAGDDVLVNGAVYVLLAGVTEPGDVTLTYTLTE